MANSADHLKAGLISGAVVTGLTSYMRAGRQGRPIILADVLRDALVGLLAAGVGSILPDVVEPPRHPGHRSVFHSRLTLVSVPVVGAMLINSADLSESGVAFWEGLAVGYVSHLVLDSGTPSGLP